MSNPEGPRFDLEEELEVVRVIDAILLGDDDIDVPSRWLMDVPESAAEKPPEEAAAEEEGLIAQLKNMNVPQRAKLALKGNKEARSLLLRDANRMIQRAVLQNPRITEDEILTVARNRSAEEECIKTIAANRDWMKNYSLRHALVENPKTPLHQALRLLNTLADRDLARIGKSKNVPTAVASQARRVSFQKQGIR